MFGSWNSSKDRLTPSTPAAKSAASTRDRGQAGEAIARRYLKRRGFKILDTNYLIRGGEIDIVAREQDTLVFIEVKASASPSFEDPLAWVPQWKQDRIVKAALIYIKAHGGRMDAPMRFDVLTVDAEGRIRHIRDAFRPSDRFFV